MSEPTDFLGLVAAGQARPEDIDDYIDAWHDGPSSLELHQFLGMSSDEYATWLKRPDSLPELCRARLARASRQHEKSG